MLQSQILHRMSRLLRQFEVDEPPSVRAARVGRHERLGGGGRVQDIGPADIVPVPDSEVSDLVKEGKQVVPGRAKKLWLAWM